VLEAAAAAGVRIPRLCHVPGLPSRAVCRLCLVEVEGRAGWVPACGTPAVDGMSVRTDGAALVTARRTVMELILAEHGPCAQPGCEVEAIAREVGVTDSPFVVPAPPVPTPPGSDFIELDPARCVHCDRCIRKCSRQVITRRGRGPEVLFGFEDGRPMTETSCTGCGDCVAICPAGTFAPRRPSGLRRAARRPPEGHDP